MLSLALRPTGGWRGKGCSPGSLWLSVTCHVHILRPARQLDKQEAGSSSSRSTSVLPVRVSRALRAGSHLHPAQGCPSLPQARARTLEGSSAGIQGTGGTAWTSGPLLSPLGTDQRIAWHTSALGTWKDSSYKPSKIKGSRNDYCHLDMSYAHKVNCFSFILLTQRALDKHQSLPRHICAWCSG